MVIQNNLIKQFFLLGIILTLFSGCTNEKYQFYLGTANDGKLIQLFRLLDEADQNKKTRMEVHYTIMNKIISEYKSVEEPEKMILFLTDYINTHEHDPYTAYYLLNIAENYIKSEARTVAETYFRRILYNYPDLIINSRSIHRIILEELAFYSSDYEERISSFNELLTRFPGEVDKGQIYYHLGKCYEELGFWDEAFQDPTPLLIQSLELV